MSYIRLNITDQKQTIHDEVHGSFGDVILAALTAEPETIDELAWAVEHFVKSGLGLNSIAFLLPMKF